MKKLICLIVCFVLLAQAVPQNVMAAQAFDSRISHDIILLFENTGILEKNDPFATKTDSPVTRGEFARLLVRVIGLGDMADSYVEYEDLYADVKTSTQYYQEIIFASKLGLFGDKINNRFQPKEAATVMWAQQALARSLGYGQHLRVNPSAVYSLGILDGITCDDGFLHRECALIMLRNALDIPVIEMVGISGDDLVLRSTDKRNFLAVYHGIYTAEDVLLSDYFTALTGEKPDRGYVRFKDGIFNAADLETKKLVGLNLRYYYKQCGNEKKILHFEKLENTQLTITVDNASYSYSQNRYTVNIGGKDKFALMELDTLVSYNGKPHFDKNKMLPAKGQVTLVDNDGDGRYEVCMIREYHNILVGSVSVSNEKIYDSFDNSLNVNIKDYDRFVLYGSTGDEIGLDKVSGDSVITLYVSADAKDAEGYVSEKTASAKLEETDFANGTVKADGLDYSISNDLRMAASSLKAGQNYYLYLNHLNELVYASANWQHETLYVLETGTDGVLETGLYIKGLNASGEIGEYALSDRVNWVTHQGGIVNISKDDAYARLNSNGGRVNRQLIKFSTDFDGKIKEIVIAHELSDRTMMDSVNPDYPLVRLSYYSDPAQWPQDFLTYVATASKNRVSYSGGIFGHFMPFSSSTVEMIVPFNSTISYAESDVHSWVWSALQTTPTAYVENFDAYGSGGDCITVDYLVSAIGTRTSKTDAGYNMQPYLVLGVSDVVDSGTDAITKLKLSNRNGVVSDYYLSDETVISKDGLEKQMRAEGASSATLPADKTTIAAGDIVSVQLDSKGKIERLRLIYDGKGQRDIHPPATSTLNTTGDIIVGRIGHHSGSIFEINAMAGSDIAENTNLVYKIPNGILEYDARLNTVRVLTPDDINTGDKVHVVLRYGSCRMLIIYKNL